MSDPKTKEDIDVDKVFGKDAVEDIDIFKTKASVKLTYAALAVGVIALICSSVFDIQGLQSWSTGLISAIAGAAISYGFASKS